MGVRKIQTLLCFYLFFTYLFHQVAGILVFEEHI